ncbi:hypothetical protein NSTC745_06328 [Nostoc sp. DSM 114161]|jgi:hypothetical protein|uniref:hypothetical protein n=1 Tax=Nostoc sp. DSM 114161 TaxID=3440143 RepID=UPI0040461082
MAYISTTTCANGSSISELPKAMALLSDAHQILVQHQSSFASEGENPLEHTRKAIKLLQEILDRQR